MLRKIALLAVVVLGLAPAFMLAGCQTSSSEPYGLTGPRMTDRQHYTDDKGMYHADLAAQQRPLR